MDKFSAEQLARLTAALSALETELHAGIAAGQEDAKPVELDGSIGRVTRIDAIQQQSMAKANLGANRLRLKRVQSARRALAEGHYGECQSCGELIAFKRLLARPEARFCIECKEDSER